MELLLAVRRFQQLSLFSAFTPADYIWVINSDVRETSLSRHRGGRCMLFVPHKDAMTWFLLLLVVHLTLMVCKLSFLKD